VIPKRRYDKVAARACLPVITVHGGLHNKQGKKILGKYEPISCSKILRKTDTEGAVIFYEPPSSSTRSVPRRPLVPASPGSSIRTRRHYGCPQWHHDVVHRLYRLAPASMLNITWQDSHHRDDVVDLIISSHTTDGASRCLFLFLVHEQILAGAQKRRI